MPTTFQESDLQFTFSDHWIVKSFDEHPFYKSLAGRGLKGVDFIGILNHETVVLIEVKNYKIRFPTAPPAIQSKIAGNSPTILETMRRKATDTQRVLRIIRKYYERRWWLRGAQVLLNKLPLRYQLKVEWQFWLWLEVKVAQEDYTLVLWMELEEEYEFFSSQQLQRVRKKLARQLQNIPQRALLASSDHPFVLNEKISVVDVSTLS